MHTSQRHAGDTVYVSVNVTVSTGAHEPIHAVVSACVDEHGCVAADALLTAREESVVELVIPMERYAWGHVWKAS